jgi:hypothetical protein
MRKPTTALGYDPSLAEDARRVCLYVATVLGDLADDLVVVGGLVPYLIVDQETAGSPHVGTRDLDLGLSLAVLDDERYREISARLRDRSFEAGKEAEGEMTRQTWVHPGTRVTIDFLIPRSATGPAPGRLQNLEADFAAIVTPALPLAFEDCEHVVIDGLATARERAKRTVRVCGPAAFVVMKAHAQRLRGENKDAYDLVYLLEHYGDGTTDAVADRLRSLAVSDDVERALTILAEDFASPDHLGATRCAEFISGRRDARVQASAFGYVQAFLRAARRT